MKQRALVFVDMVLDTVYGTVKQLNEDLAELLVMSPGYRLRHHDNLSELTNGAIDDAEFKTLYAARDIETLYHSKMTDFVQHLREDMLEGVNDMLRGVQVDSLVVDINFWPYELDAASMETVRRSIAYFLPPQVTVNSVRIDPGFLTPRYLDGAYEMMAIYDHEDWLGPQTEALIEMPIPNFVVLTPQLASSGVVPEATSEIGNPFLCRSATLVRFVALHYMDVGRVCYNPAIRQLIRSQRQQEYLPPETSHPEQS